MSHNGPTPPPARCLIRPDPPSQKGGTLIAEDVTDRAEHERRICAPGGYRPKTCGRCGNGALHVHDYRGRTLRGEEASSESPPPSSIFVVRYQCAACLATWRIVPGFLARLLWRRWSVVEQWTLGPPPPPTAPEIPPRTLGRWHDRLKAAARYLLAAVATRASAALDLVAEAVGTAGTHEDLLLAHAAASGVAAGERLAALAALVHRLVPGVRVM